MADEDSTTTLPVPEMGAFAPRTINDLNQASKEDLIDYLKVHNVPFGEDAFKPELLGKAREYFSIQAVKTKQPDDDEPKLISPKVQEPAIIRNLESRGFQNKEDIVHYLNALTNKEVEIANREKEIARKLEDIARKDIENAGREASIEAAAAKVRELNKQNDLQLQALKQLKQS